jgi:solute carrier family 25 S-adenosylmethionine transporter 26
MVQSIVGSTSACEVSQTAASQGSGPAQRDRSYAEEGQRRSGSLKEPAFRVALIAGGVAGTSVDMALFPLDTVKTRMQSGDFYRSGGFRGVYNGVFAAAAGSAPGAALFFSTYETVKQKLTKRVEPEYHAWCYMMSSACGEVAACWIRVPTENVKQKIQAGIYPNLHECIRGISRSSKGYRAFYKGYTATVSREIPFSFIQFPIYETLKKRWSARQGSDVTPIQVSLLISAIYLLLLLARKTNAVSYKQQKRMRLRKAQL